MKSILIKQAIESNNEKEMIIAESKININTYSEDEYKHIFEDLVTKGIIKLTTFEANKWIIVDEFLFQSEYNFPFELKPNLNKALKYYVLVKLGLQQRSKDTVQKHLKVIIDFIVNTNYLNSDKVIVLRNEVSQWSDTNKRMIYAIQEFLAFSEIDHYAEYNNVLRNVAIPNSNTRKIPAYQSIFIFDYIMKDFINTGNYKLKMELYPLIIWWELTKIIPLRPKELCLLQRESVYMNQGKFYIHVDRSKEIKGDYQDKKILPLNTIEISEELYTLLTFYIEESKKFNNSKYLLNYEFIVNFREVDRHYNQKINKDFVGTDVLKKQLEKFNRDIVSKQYGYRLIPKGAHYWEEDDDTIERINLGDTRHIAICSMMLQGVDELTIARLAGHSNLTEQIHYSNHLDTYVQAYTYTMAKSFSNRITLLKGNMNTTASAKKMILRNALLNDECQELRKLATGWCKSKNFPFECYIDDHIGCPNYINNSNLSKELLDTQLKSIEKDRTVALGYLKSIIINENKENPQLNNELKTTSKRLNSIIFREAILQSYRMNLEVME